MEGHKRDTKSGEDTLTLAFLKWHISSKIAHTLFTGDRQFVPSNPGWLWRVSSRGTQEGTQEGHKPRGRTQAPGKDTSPGEGHKPRGRTQAPGKDTSPGEGHKPRGGTHTFMYFIPKPGQWQEWPLCTLQSIQGCFFLHFELFFSGTHGGTQFWAGGTLEDTKNDVTESTGTHRTWKGHKKAQNGTQRDTKTGKRTHSPWPGKWQEWPLCVLQSITGCFFLHFKLFFSRGHT